MAVVGYATLPIIPSLDGIAKKLSASFEAPAAKSAAKAAQSIEGAMAKAADNASYALKKAREREQEATQKVLDLEKKVQAERDAAERKQQSIAAAELARDRQISDSKAKVTDAQRKLDQARESGKATSEEIAELERKVESASLSAAETKIKAENRVETAIEGHRKALDKVESATKSYRDAQENAASKSEQVLTAQKRLDTQTSLTTKEFQAQQREAQQLAGDLDHMESGVGRLGDAFQGAVGKIGALAGIAGLGGLIAEGIEVTAELGKMERQMGLTGDSVALFRGEVHEALSGGIASNAEEAASAIQGLNQQFGYLGFEGEQTAAELSDNFLAFSKTFDVDMPEAVQTAGQLIQNGLASDVENAADLMTTAFQRVPVAMRDELPEILNEYGTNFRALGFNGEEAFSLLVSASEKGKFALDKTGDSLKEFTIRGADMSTTSVEAYEAIGLNAEEMSRMVATGGEAAQEALMKTAGGLQDIEDPAERANMAIALFGTPLEDLSVDQIPDFLDGLTGLGDGMQGAAGASQAMADQMADSLEGRMNTLKGTVSSLASDGFMKLWDAGEKVASWARDNSTWLTPLAVGIGATAAAVTAWTAATKAYSAATEIATVVTTIFDKATKATVFGAIAAAVIGVVAALTYFFTQTETGQKAWETFTRAIGTAWDWVKDKLSAGFELLKTAWESVSNAFMSVWNSVLKPVFDAVWQVVQTTIAVIGTVVFAPLLLAWEALSAGISWWWENVTKPAFETMGAIASWLYDTILSPIFTYIGDKWSETTTRIGDGWTLIKSYWDTMATVVGALYNTYLAPIFTSISDKWTWLGGIFSTVWATIRDSVITKFQDTLTTFKSFFSTITDGIGQVWDGLKSKLAKPINFFISTVYGRGVKPAWDTMASFLPGISEAPSVAPIPEHKDGGRISGPGTGTSDDVLMWGSNGEHMLTAKEVRDLGGHAAVYAMREAVNQGRPFTFDGRGGVAILPRTDERAGDLAGAAPGLLIPGFKDGGAIRPMWELQLENGHRAAKMRNGNPYTWGFEDCSGYMSAIADAIINGGNGKWSWATGSFPGGQPWVPGLGQGFSVGVHDNPGGPGGGHTAGTLTGVGPYSTVNVESGGGHGYVAYGGPAAGADSAQFQGVHPGQFHLGIGADGAFESGGGGGGPSPDAMLAKIREKIESTVDAVFSPILDQLPSPPPQFLAVPKAGYDVGKTEILDTAFGIAESLGDKLRTAYEAVKDLADLATGAIGRGVDWVSDRAASAIGLHDEGGWLKPGEVATNRLRKPEPVLTPPQWDDVSSLVNQKMPALAESVDVMAKEIGEAYRGGDYGYGELAHYLGDQAAYRVVDEAAWAGAAVQEVRAAFQGEDFGLAATARYVGGNEQIAAQLLRSAESFGVVAEEMAAAWNGEDFGYGETASYIGASNAQALLDEVSWIGNTVKEFEAAWNGDDFGSASLARYLGGNQKIAEQLLDIVENIGRQTAGVRDFISEQMKYSWDDRMGFLADHMAGITINQDGEREQTRGRIGTPEEIAQWAATEIGFGVLGEAAGLIGLEGLVPDAPRFLDDDLRVGFTKESTTTEETPTETDIAETDDTVADTVADQTAASTKKPIILKGTNFDAAAVTALLEDLGHKVEQQGEDIADIKDDRRSPGSLTRSL